MTEDELKQLLIDEKDAIAAAVLAKAIEAMTESVRWQLPGDPMPCKCGESVVGVELRSGFQCNTSGAYYFDWGKIHGAPSAEITAWRFVERKGEDVIAAYPYDALEWDEDDTATVVLKMPGQPWWVRDDDLVRFHRLYFFKPAADWGQTWNNAIAFQIKRRLVLTPAVPQLLTLLAVADDAEAAAIRRAARRVNIEVKE